MIFPLLEISAPGDPQLLAQAIARLDVYELAIFISPNAVEHALPAILARGPWPAGLVPAAIGQGTVKALAVYGVTASVAPRERFDSEALLALPEMIAVSDKRIAIFRGEGGRELLADTLSARGANVDCVACYRRSAPAAAITPLLAAWRAGRLDALTVSSSEALRNLLAALDAEGRDFLQNTPLFVAHERIAEKARALGLSSVVLTEPSDPGMVSGLLAYDWPLKTQPE